MNKHEPLAEPLTIRELEILALLVENKTNQEIADILHLALSSVKWYAGEIYGKLGVENRRQAVKKATELGLLDKPGQEPQKPAYPSGIVTFLFTDIEGSTPLWEQMPEAMQVAIVQHHTILRQSIESNGGQAFQVIGDGFQAAFRLASDGLCAALAAQRALRDAHWGPTGPLNVRMGLHTGPAELDSHGDATYQVSHTLNRVARVMSAGYGGQVLLSQEAADLVERELSEGVSLKDLGEHHLKGMERAEHLYQAVVADLQQEFPPLPTAVQNPNNLPQELTSFIGREDEILRLVKDIQERKTRLVTLTGSGGTGKTRLSLKVAEKLLEAFPAGVWLVELAPLSDPQMVIPTVAQVLGVHDLPRMPLIDTLCSYLKNKRALLILDNCEHLLDACAALAETLLRTCSEVYLLASSREILNVPGEAPLRVPSLLVPDGNMLPPVAQLGQFESVRLFVERAAQVSAGFTLDESNAQAVVTVCRRLDGIPLAIELAASRVRVMQVGQIAARLDNVFRLLMGGARTVMPRQQTLKATIDWSYNLLSQREKTALQRLSIFSGGWTLEAADQIIPDFLADTACGEERIEPEGLLDLLASLVDKSLVMLSEGESQEPGGGFEPRYRMLETIRQYARDRMLEAAGSGGEPEACDSEAVRDRHLAYYLALSEEAEQRFRTKDQVFWLERMATELDNMRLALEWALGGHLVEGMRLASALKWFWSITSRYVEGNTWFDRLLTLEEESRGTIPLEVGVQDNCHLLAWVRCVNALAMNRDYNPRKLTRGKIVEMLELGIDLCRKMGNTASRELFWVLLYRGIREPEYDNAYMNEALQIAREKHYRYEEAEVLYHLWIECLMVATDFRRGATFLEPSLAICRELQDVDGIATRLIHSIFLAELAGDKNQVNARYLEAIRCYRLENNTRMIHIWAPVFLRFSQDHQSIEQAERALEYFIEMQDYPSVLMSYEYLLHTEWSNGNMVHAAQLAEKALVVQASVPLTSTMSSVSIFIYLSKLCLSQGDLVTTRQNLLKIGPSIQQYIPRNLDIRINFLDTLCAYFVRTGDFQRAVQGFGAIDSLYQEHKNLFFPRDHVEHEGGIQTARLALGEEDFRGAWETGRAMDFRQAFDALLEALLTTGQT